MISLSTKGCALLIACFAICDSDAASHVVEIRNNFFSPRELTVQAGDTVVWVQRGFNHDTESVDGLWSSGILSSGAMFSFTFNNPGSFDYYCNPHRNQGMTGTITVEGAANTPPVVTVSAPANGAQFSIMDNITFTADATDNGTVASVEFFANENSIGSTTTPPFGIVTTLGEGTYSITARATDDQGLSTTSAAVTITIQAAAENQLPTISLTSAQTLLAVGTALLLQATAADPDGSISKVEFFNGSNSAGSLSGGPFELSLADLAPGVYSFTAVATDDDGGTTTSSPLQIRVAARPRIDSITRDQGETALRLSGTSAIEHTVEAAETLGAWVTLGTVTPADGAGVFTDSAQNPRRFYRVLVK